MRYLIALLCLSLFSCGTTPVKKVNTEKTSLSTSEVEYTRSIKIVSPKKHSMHKLDSKISLSFSIEKGLKTDSVQVFANNILLTTLKKAPFTLDYTIKETKLGNCQIKALAFHDKNKRGLAVTNITLLPSKAPVHKTYKVIKTFTHSRKDYTQGLTFHKGYLYEGTGHRGQSCIKKTDIKTNQTIAVLDIDKHLFGEGITIYNDKIIQLTWQAQRGFVYDLNTFSLESEFTYSTQGWGITTMGDELVMSDGSNKLYFLDPSSFSVKSYIEVYDNKGAVEQLNELEYINGMIYANVWLTNRIVIIDPKTGQITADVDMTGILSMADQKDMDMSDEVLNGIAYDEETNHLFVTGKHWPKLFQIELK
jgi:glutamine cyclotransferase